ncbi:MAG: hypothetical protein NC206_08630 [Bacteroides sp.]|nr:hypothetical protein [Roseburia sp.]MCM1347135.1 hypothetical protein [Bacteroides sp.]MCM1421628.1 hypothetical protein [Bacteroides sp.]
MWFKAYIMRNDNENVTALSHVLYVELVSSGGDIMKTKKLAIIDGTAEGTISLDDILLSGFYEVRAYTRYMTNWGTDACFSRIIPVFDKPEKNGDYSHHTMTDPNTNRVADHWRYMNPNSINKSAEYDLVTFYPEGGRLIKGISSNVAFKIKDKNGKYPHGDNIYITDSVGNVCHNKISMSIDGLGKFRYLPDDSNRFLVIKDFYGKDVRVKIPVPEEKGCAIAVDVMNDKKIFVEFTASVGIRGKDLGMMLLHHGNLLYSNTIRIGTEPYTLMLRRNDIPAGVSSIIIFNNSGEILSERLFFIPPPRKKIQIIPITTGIIPCGKVKLEIHSLPDASLSLSVMDAASVTGKVEGSMRTWLTLSSEIKGYTTHPEYYFEEDDAAHRLATDLLMMTRSWRTYDMRQMTGNDTMLLKQPIEDKLYLYGFLSSRKKRHNIENVDVSVYMYNDKGQVMKGSTTTDIDGKYAFELPDCNGEWNTIIRTKKDGNSTAYNVAIDRNFSPPVRHITQQEVSALSAFVSDNSFIVSGDSALAVDVLRYDTNENKFILPTVKIKRKRIYDDAKSSWESESRGKWKAQLYYDCDKEADIIADKGNMTPDFLDWITTRNSFFAGNRNFHYEVNGYSTLEMEDVNTVDIANNKGAKPQILDTIQIVRRHSDDMRVLKVDAANLDACMFNDGLTYKNRPVVWIIDNSYMMVSGLNNRKMNVEGIAEVVSAVTMPNYLDEVKSVYISEDKDIFMRYIQSADLQAINPVTVFVYTHHQFYERLKGTRRTHFQGFDEPSTFQMEDYSVLPAPDDFRRTIYWNPDVRTDKDGKATVEFYNNSTCTQMYISAEGMTKDGQFVTNE